MKICREGKLKLANLRSLPLLVGATALALGASAVPSLQKNAAQSRDIQRLEALFQIDRALQAWQLDHGEPPMHVSDPYAGGWETTRNGTFIEVLTQNGYLPAMRLDPINNKQLQFRYHRYAPGQYDNDEPFYILAITAFESEATLALLPTPSAGLRVGNRDWSEEFPMVLGGL